MLVTENHPPSYFPVLKVSGEKLLTFINYAICTNFFVNGSFLGVNENGANKITAPVKKVLHI
jgi:hypothetical protein